MSTDKPVWTAAEMGRKGGKARVPRGFAKATPEQRAAWGRLGGRKSQKAQKAASETTYESKVPRKSKNPPGDSGSGV
jgi:general stress protein YciG